jgi:hypothetical protein
MKKLFEKCREAIRANLIPGFVLQVFGLALVLGYYYVPFVHDLCEQLSQLKARHGIMFAGISTSVAGGVIPVIFLVYMKRIPREKALVSALFYVGFWFWKGLEIDIFYRYQAIWFGDDPTFKVIASKVLFDQFVWNPLYAAPCIALVYFWKDCDFSFKRFRKGVNREMFFLKIPTVLVSTWIVWFPMCAIIYSLPTLLQVPLFNIVLCFFVLLVNIICDDSQEE